MIHKISVLGIQSLQINKMQEILVVDAYDRKQTAEVLLARISTI